MDILNFLTHTLSIGGDFLSEGGKKMLSEQVIITGIVLFSLRSHFKNIEAGIAKVADNVNNLGRALTNVETSHSERIGNLEKKVTLIEQRTTKRNS